MSALDVIQDIFTAVDGVSFEVNGNAMQAQAYLDLSGKPNLPGIVFGAPHLTYEAYNTGDPSEITIYLYLIVQSDGYILINMEPFITAVSEALYERTTDVVVTQAIPGAFTHGGSDLPCYVLTLEANP
jgi:hypothetical protein